MSERNKKNEQKTYVFTVEGNTEKWYLDWLEKLINAQCDRNCTVKILPVVETNPEAYAKRINPLSTPLVVHLCDYEGKSAEDEKQFLHALDKLSAANKARRGSFRYELGYSNLTFELWMILHKSGCNGLHSDKRQYLNLLNKAYGTDFESLTEYKEEANFQKCLKQLTLDDVRTAISRAKKIMDNNKVNCARQRQYKGFRYYEDNPSITIWESILLQLKSSYSRKNRFYIPQILIHIPVYIAYHFILRQSERLPALVIAYILAENRTVPNQRRTRLL